MDKELNPNPQNQKKDNAGYHKNYRKKHYHNKKRNTQPSSAPAVEGEKSEGVVSETPKAESPVQPVGTQNTQNPNGNRHKHSRNRRNRPHHNNTSENAKDNSSEVNTNATDVDKSPVIDAPKTRTNEPEEYISTIAESSAETSKKPTEEKEGELVEIIGVRFKVGGKTYYFSPNGIVGKKGANAIVETARGLEFGEIVVANSMVHESEFVPPLRPVIRLATEVDVKHHNDNKAKQDDAFRICNEKIISHGLDMKLIDAQYTFDNSKLLFYFTSAGRVDFRELVKDLASVFKTRIELRQIGIRDEAKLIGGLGICGRSLCCSVFLSDFGQVSIKMAKEQNLSLNSSKISGACGRLMCCLRYEYDTYVQEIKKTPAVDSKVKTPDGIGTVTEISPLVGKIKVRLDDKPDQAPRSFSRNDVTIILKERQ